MPNHVEHDMYVKGPRTIMNDFRELLKDSYSNIEGDKWINLAAKIVPYPPEKAIIEKQINEWAKEHNAQKDWTGHPFYIDGEKNVYCPIHDWFNNPTPMHPNSGYMWANENWGTKWGMYELILEYENDYNNESEMTLTFKTAWVTPTKLIGKLSKMFPELEFEICWFESGNEKSGRYKYQNGRLISEEFATYFGKRGG